MPGHSSTITPFALVLLTNTEWDNSSDGIIGVLFPNFFIVYFGQNFPKGDISPDDIKVNFAKLGATNARRRVGRAGAEGQLEGWMCV